MSLVYAIGAVHALRMWADRHRALGGALGLAADLWPHQVINVAAILEDTEVRHVLADEVGLGKTVQALAVIRATLLSQPRAKVAIFCPDELVRQWFVEALVRAGLVLNDGSARGDDDPEQWAHNRPLLLWPARVKDGGKELLKALGAADLLVVDELPRLTLELQGKLCAAMAEAAGALVLTANPPLRDDEECARLLKVIEPRRTAPDAPWSAAVRREEAAAEALELRGAPSAERAAAAARLGAARRVLRAARAEAAAPNMTRIVRVIWVEPTPVEREREELLWRWMKTAVDTTRRFDHERIGQRGRSVPSIRQRATYLIGEGHDRDGLLTTLRDGLTASGGDSRVDALFDLLASIWAAEPEARVVIGANDNLTVDHLAELIPKVFDEGGADGEPVVVARIRNQTEGPGALVDAEDVVAEQVRAFTVGAAKVMLLPDDCVAGINLQVARHVIIYACTWRLTELDQLIGRVDRLDGAPGARRRPVEVTVLAHRGLVDQRVVEVVLQAGVLDRPLAAGLDEVDELNAALIEAATSDSKASWRKAMAAAERLGGRGALPDALLPLRQHQRDRGAAAEATLRRCLGRGWTAAGRADETASPEAREAALWAWLTDLERAGVYALEPPRGRARRLRYANTGPNRHGTSHLPHPLAALPHAGSAARFWRRKDSAEILAHLSRCYAEWGNRTPAEGLAKAAAVELLEHGGELFEALMCAFLPTARRQENPLEVYARRGGRLWGLRSGAAHLAATAACAPTLGRQGEASSPQLEAATAADQRWLDGRVGGALITVGRWTSKAGEVRSLTDEELAAALHPAPESDVERWQSSVLKRSLTPQERGAAAAAGRELGARWAAWWAERLPDLQAAVEERAALLEGERDDLAALIRAEREAGRLSAAALRAREKALDGFGVLVAERVARLRAAVAVAPEVERSLVVTIIVGA
ncbi:MAG: hypothetical protein JNM72_25175 [Deltaproteobacteria bacterium]|nr:hypothetical protein [Deltaproteobacteria bacterium]